MTAANVIQMGMLALGVGAIYLFGRVAGCESHCDDWQGKYPDRATCVQEEKGSRVPGI